MDDLKSADDLDYSIDTGLSVAYALHDSKEVLEQKTGTPIETQTTIALEQGVNCLLKCVGIKPTKVISREAFGKFGKTRAREVAIEAISDHIITVIKKIISWIKLAVKKVFTTIERSRTSAVGLSKRAARIESSGKEATSKTLKQGRNTIDNTHISSFFSVGTKLLEPHNVLDLYKGHVDKFTKQNFSAENIKKSLQAVNELAVTPVVDVSVDVIRKKISDCVTGIKNALLGGFTAGFGATASDDKNEILSHALPFNNQSVVAILEKQGDLYTSMKLVIKPNIRDHENHAMNHIKILVPTDITATARLVKNEMEIGVLNALRNVEKEMKQAESSVEKACVTLLNYIKNKPDSTRDDLTLVDFLRAIVATLAAATVSVQQYEEQAGVRLLDFCEASLDSYE